MASDFFDLTGLPFDPPEKSAKKVKAAIEKKEKELGALLGTATQTIDRVELQSQLNLLSDVSAKILSQDGKTLIDGEYTALANNRLQTELKALRSIAELMLVNGNSVITTATVKFHRKERMLSEDHVLEVFTSLGFEVKKFDKLDVSKLFPNQIDRIDRSISALRMTKTLNPNASDVKLVTDLYSFAAFLNSEPENAPLYREKYKHGEAELFKLFEASALKLSQSPDERDKLCAAIVSLAKIHVFNSPENHQKYELYLKYRSPELSGLFESMHGAPEPVLLDPVFADPCIKKISGVMGISQDVALAVYNHEGGIEYTPVQFVYYVKCHQCGAVNEYKSEAEAIKNNSCTNCKKALFKQCPKCRKMTLFSNAACPEPCGYVFAGAAVFGKYYSMAEAALRRCDFEEAQRYLSEAQAADPSETQKTGQLKKAISAQEAEYKAPIDELRKLIAAGRFFGARKALAATVKAHPNLNVSAFESQISSALSAADRKFTAALSLPPSKRADECVSILQSCTDHQDALNFLRVTPPLQCRQISVVPDNTKGVINISWICSQEQGVRYCLVRKDGRSAPISIFDGKSLANDPGITSYCDATAEAGLVYTYALFITRADVPSPPVCQTAFIYPEVQNLRIIQNGNAVRLTWDSPKNSIGATVSRAVAGSTSVLSRSAHESFEDSGVQFGVAYTYTVTANYSDTTSSAGIKGVITPFFIVDSFKIRASQASDNIYAITWDIRQPDVSLRVLVNGTVSGECKSGDGSIKITLPRESLCTVIVAAYSGGQWINSENQFQINTYSPCSIDKSRTELREEAVTTQRGTIFNVDLRIRLAGSIPSGAAGFYYAVRTEAASARWATADEIGKAPDISFVTANDYQHRKELIYTTSVRNERAFYISVFTVYNVSGKNIISAPKMMKINRIILADIFWKITKSLFGPADLTITVEGNRPLDHMPELVLCACDENEFITAYDAPKSTVLCKVPSVDLEPARKTYTQSLELDKRYVQRGMKYFLFEKDPVNSEKYSIRWMQGFTGKV